MIILCKVNINQLFKLLIIIINKNIIILKTRKIIFSVSHNEEIEEELKKTFEYNATDWKLKMCN